MCLRRRMFCDNGSILDNKNVLLFRYVFWIQCFIYATVTMSYDQYHRGCSHTAPNKTTAKLSPYDMHRQTYAQRLHIINSVSSSLTPSAVVLIPYQFDALLYQLHVLSFFLSPSLWSLCCRILSQIQCTKPRTFDPNRSLRFWYLLIILLNATSFWHHAVEGAAVGKAVVLDFVGMGVW
jgi:hypothetical protein